ncbi:hypothetical protein F4778DRAFT_257345 [Xylariomycetidae sp. FL2044]|nr:hypothetical protein F4778DRAFT_257345 [Xylariomycetidae sp. FL2044]
MWKATQLLLAVASQGLLVLGRNPLNFPMNGIIRPNWPGKTCGEPEYVKFALPKHANITACRDLLEQAENKITSRMLAVGFDNTTLMVSVLNGGLPKHPHCRFGIVPDTQADLDSAEMFSIGVEDMVDIMRDVLAKYDPKDTHSKVRVSGKLHCEVGEYGGTPGWKGNLRFGIYSCHDMYFNQYC